MFGSFLPSALGWFRSHQSLLGYRSRHCHGINFTNYPGDSQLVKSPDYDIYGCFDELPFASHWNASSKGTLNTLAIRKAASSDGEYFPASIAAMVCRVTPMRSPSSACDISPFWKRRKRIRFVIDPFTILPSLFP